MKKSPANFEYELEKKIYHHLETWADWSRMSEDDQDETFDEIYAIVRWAIVESPTLKQDVK